MWSHHRGMEVRRSVRKYLYIYIMMVCLPFLCVLIESCAKIVYSSYCSFCKFPKGVLGLFLYLLDYSNRSCSMCKAWLNPIVHSSFFSFQGFFAGPNQRSSITYAVPKTKKGCAANIHRPGPLKPTLLHWRHMYTLCFHPSTSTKHIDNLCGRQW